MNELLEELKKEIISALNLDINPGDIDVHAPIFGDGLGLDSIDALELIVLMEKKYGIKLTDQKKAKTIFQSVYTMAEFIHSNRK